MTKELQTVICPNCKTPIDVGNVLYYQLEEQVKLDYKGKLSELEKQKNDFEKTVESAVKTKIQSEKSDLEKRLRNEIKEEASEEIRAYQQQLQEKSDEIKKMNKLRSELAQAKRDRDELKEKIEAESQEKLNSLIKEEKTKIRSQVDKENELKISERDRMIENLNEQMKSMQKRIEQGSMQVQGEIMELAIEQYLRTSFPLDTIEEIKKGARGADSLQIVNTRTRQNCGSIYFESKRTQAFQPSWIEKFKEDMRLKNATLGVIVTDTMPKTMEYMGQIDGVWICSYQEFKGLCYALRETIILCSNAIITQENRGEKMSLLYDYLCSSEFQREITAIVEAFTTMNTELLSEQRSMAMIWKKRQRQIDKVLTSTINMVGSIKGISSNIIGTIPLLELPAPIEEV